MRSAAIFAAVLSLWATPAVPEQPTIYPKTDVYDGMPPPQMRGPATMTVATGTLDDCGERPKSASIPGLVARARWDARHRQGRDRARQRHDRQRQERTGACTMSLPHSRISRSLPLAALLLASACATPGASTRLSMT
jgi:hypothetical protein